MKNLLNIAAIGLGIAISMLGVTTSALAQGGYGAQNAFVTVYEDCNFSGTARNVSVGDYRSLKTIRFANDRMSSIKVPPGLEVTIYENDNYGGAYASIDQDISCFDYQWDNKVSSLKVQGNRGNNQAQRQNNDGARFGANRGDRNDRQRNDNVTAQNVSQVVFEGSVLQQNDRNSWSLKTPQNGASQYREVSRDQNSVYLQNDYTAERVRIDVFANDVTFIYKTGKQQRYAIDRRQASLANTQAAAPARADNNPSRRINSDCFTFKAYTTGGNGGLRFQGKGDVYRFDRKPASTRVCHDGSLTMEITKTDRATDVIVELDGKRYRFAANEQEDELVNNWYRKYVRLSVGR